jgi:2-oxoglutarate dehydrogenase complex dehydrogenase (E1) component-like enzyme
LITKARNKLEDLSEVKKFKTVLPERQPADCNEKKDIKKLYICCGQIYYELIERRKVNKRKVAQK